MRDDRDSESNNPIDPLDEVLERNDGTLQMLPEPVSWNLEDLYEESVVRRPAMLFWDETFKLPSGSRLVFWNQMIRALRASNFDEVQANTAAEEDAKERNKPWPHKGPFISIASEGLRRNVRLYRFRFNPNSKDFFIVVLMGPSSPDGQKSGRAIGWFEAKTESDIQRELRDIQDGEGL